MTETAQVSPSPAGSRRPRIEAFDAVRGIYMVIITALHLMSNLRPAILNHPGLALFRLGISGTVAFVSMSGFMAGYLLQRRPERAPAITGRYRSQALKLLLAHPVILFALYDLKRLTVASHGVALRSWFITDTFAAMFLVIIPLLPRLKPAARLLAGTACIVVSRLLYVLHLGRWAVALLLMDILVGTHPTGPRVLYENYALLALTGMFLIGSQLGQMFARAEAEGREHTMPGRYLRVAVVLLGVGLSLLGLWVGLRHGGQTVLRAMLYPDYHLPLYPIHLAAALGLVAFLLRTRWLPGARQFLAVIGRRSLVVYVAQYYLVQWLPFGVKWYGHMTVPEYLLYLGASVLILQRFALLFERAWRWDLLALVGWPTTSPEPMPGVALTTPPDPPDLSRPA